MRPIAAPGRNLQTIEDFRVKTAADLLWNRALSSPLEIYVMANIIEQLESEQMQRQVPAFAPGDTVVVQVKVKEGTRERLQAFEGVEIGRAHV